MTEHPKLIVALMDALPPPDSEWPIEKRAQWLRAAAEIMALVYGSAPEAIEIVVMTGAEQRR